MKKQDFESITEEIKSISFHFEDSPFSHNMKSLKEDFDMDVLNSPNSYLSFLDEINEFSRQARILFVTSVYKVVCKQNDVVYYFDQPFDTGIKYLGVTKKNNSLYLIDNDGHLRDLFASEEFMRFTDNQYWEVYK